MQTSDSFEGSLLNMNMCYVLLIETFQGACSFYLKRVLFLNYLIVLLSTTTVHRLIFSSSRSPGPPTYVSSILCSIQLN